MTRKRITIACLLAAIVAALSIVPLAGSHNRDRQLEIGVRVDFTS